MKERLTKKFDEFPCRFKDGCPAEEWIADLTGLNISDSWSENVCDKCPFMYYINKLADYEDLEEATEDDLK